MTSRHRRPEEPAPFQLTTRDKAVLASEYRHRFLSASHVRDLHFAGSGLRVCQVRLQRMWASRLLDRLYLNPEPPDERDRYTERPLYCLAAHGAAVVAEGLDLNIDEIPHTLVQNRDGFRTLRHHLVFTDLAVAVEAMCSRTTDYHAETTREHILRRQLLRARQAQKVHQALVPDGAVTVTTPGVPTPQTYLVEVVRAGVKAGNDSIRRRLHRYRALLRSGFFRDVYGFAWVRAVVWLTPTWKRAENLARLARDLAGGERLLRFGAYEAKSGASTPTSTLSADTITTAMFMTPLGVRVPLLENISITSPSTHV